MKLLAILVAISLGSFAQNTPHPGRRHYVARCAACHGATGHGGERGPAIVSKVTLRTDTELGELIRNGIPAAGMPGISMPQAERDELIGFLRTLKEATDPRIANPLPRPAPPGASHNWPTYHGDFSGNRHSPLSEINTGNISRLRMAWAYTIPGAQRLEVTPIVIDGVMYVTTVNEVHAIDPATGRRFWQYKRPRSRGLVGDASGGINRGVAIHENRLFIVTDHAHLLALDRFKGTLLWDASMADSRQNYGATGAPLVVGDLVISGTSGGDEGVRGFLAAYKVSTGERVWRFWTVPAPGEPLADTWKGSAIEHGCATTWMTGTYDPQLDLLYWTTGNPCPDYNGDQRKGDNLYSDSVLALRPKTGELAWYFQYTPHDLHDWDAQQTPMLIDATFRGEKKKLLVHANRNGFFYVLDRTNGKFLNATPFVKKLTWAKEIGKDGRPVVIPEAVPTAAGVTACPAVEGATNWFSTAYHPGQKLFYVQALEKCTIYTKEPGKWEAGKSYYDGATRDVPTDPGSKILRALDIETGKTVWEHPQEGLAESWGGVLSTDGGLVFFGDDNGNFTALDAKAGKPLWTFPANCLWKSSPMSYQTGGKQYVAIAGPGTIYSFSLP